MGHIKEPKGIDFEVINREMTEEERQRVSEFIKTRKEQLARRKGEPLKERRKKQAA